MVTFRHGDKYWQEGAPPNAHPSSDPPLLSTAVGQGAVSLLGSAPPSFAPAQHCQRGGVTLSDLKRPVELGAPRRLQREAGRTRWGWRNTAKPSGATATESRWCRLLVESQAVGRLLAEAGFRACAWGDGVRRQVCSLGFNEVFRSDLCSRKPWGTCRLRGQGPERAFRKHHPRRGPGEACPTVTASPAFQGPCGQVPDSSF